MADQNLRFTISAIDKTQRAFGKVAAGLGRVRKSIMSVQGALVALGAGAGLKLMADQIDDLAKASSRLGMTVNELQSLQFAAGQTGASAEELEKGLTRFNRSISEASTGIGTGLRSFEALSIKVTDAAGDLRPTNDLLNEVADRLTQIESPADRVRIAFDLFGRSGVNLTNTLQGGSAELNKLREEFNQFTLELSEKNAKATENANDRFARMGETFASIGRIITAKVLPVLASIAEFLTVKLLTAFANAIKGFRDFVNGVIDIYNKAAERSFGVLDQIAPATFGTEFEARLRGIADAYKELDDAGQTVATDTMPKVVVSLDDVAAGFERTESSAYRTMEAVREVKIEFNQTKTKLTEFAEQTKETQKNLDDMAVRGLNRMEDSLMAVMQGTMSTKDAFKSMAQSIISDLMRMAIQQQITGRIAGYLGGLGGFGGGGSNYSYGQLTGRPMLAQGGIATKGQPYMVGERGRELFVPNQTGRVIPNNQLGGGGVVVNQTINLTTGISQTIRAEVTNMLPQIKEAAKGAVLDARRRGGSFSTAFGG
jgi:chemotaxis regulatin CheY-phosphate phosphatase CheZ